MQEELSALAHGTNEQQEAGNIHQREGMPRKRPRLSRVSGYRGKHVGELHRSEGPEHRHDAEGETKVAHAIDHKRLNGGRAGGGLFEPKTDQQVGRQADAFPAKEQLHEVSGGNQRQHGEGEQRQIGEEAWTAIVLGHVAPAIKVNECRHGGDNNQHHRAQRIDADRPERLEIPNIDEGRKLDREGLQATPGPLGEHQPSQGAGQEQETGRNRLRRNIADAATK